MTIIDHQHAPTAVREAPVADWVSIPELYTDPFPTFERLRAEGGVHWVPAVGRYLISTYSAVHATELDQETYSADEEGSLMKRAMGHPMLRKDDPEHHPERRAYMPTLKPATVKNVWTEIFHRNAERYIGELREKGPGADVVWDFAAPFTAESLRAITGLHNVTQADLQRWSQCLIDATGNYAEDPEVWARGVQASEEIDAAIDEMIEWHLHHPDHSLISGLLSFPEYRMPLESIRSNLKMTIGGGLNEPRDAIGVAAWALLRDPAQHALVAGDDSRWHAVFDEAIRWIAPIGMYSRQVTRETVLDGVRLPAGARLGICLLSANRDESQWSRPERFDLTRSGEGAHLAFGKGVHVCAGAWVARAQVADAALPLLFRSLPGLRLDPERPAIPGGWVFRGMDRFPVLWDTPGAAGRAAVGSAAPRTAEQTPTAAEPSGTGRHLAVVGAGPAGCYTAQALSRTLPGAQVTVFDDRPSPYGLVRSGVAGDHQGTKAVLDQFAPLFERGTVHFVGSTRVRLGEPDEEVVLAGKPAVLGPARRSQDATGAELTLDQVRESFDAVVVATGLHADRPLAIPGAGLNGVHGAGRITRWLNGDPRESGTCAADSRIRLGAEPAVVGMGNVALDVVRLLCRAADSLEGSDVHEEAHASLTGQLKTVHVVGRSRPEAAAFDPVMLREIAELPGLEHRVHGVSAAELRASADDPRCAAVLRLHETRHADTARVRVHWWFDALPDRLEGRDGTVSGLRLVTGGGAAEVPASSVITAIGFADGPDPLLPQDALTDAVRETGRVGPGLYAAGWARRGPRGTIPSQRSDARELATLIADDLLGSDTSGIPAGDDAGHDAGSVAGHVAGSTESWTPRPGISALRRYLDRATDYEGWLRIDAAERAEALPGRPRRKMTDARRQRLLSTGAWGAASRAESNDAESNDTGPTSASGAGIPLRVVFGTESGNAEVVAEALAERLGGDFSVTVQDLDEVDPSRLAGGPACVVVCSTYGDGELPSSARRFHARLTGEGHRLDGLPVLPFGLGDRTYGATYSRGVDLLTEALAAAGAEILAEPGRHDAATGQPAAEAATTWIEDCLTRLTRAAAAASTAREAHA